MTTSRPLLTLLLVATIAGHARAERPLREARSENEVYRLRITPGHGEGRPARAALVVDSSRARSDGDTEGRSHGEVWEAALVSDVAPACAFITNDGKRVITFDEFRVGGAKHAIVVYDESGAALKEHALDHVLGAEDWSHVRRDRRAIRWLDDARLRFSADDARFEVRTAWGRRVDIDMRTGELLNPPAEGGAPPEFADLLIADENAAEADTDPNAINATPEDLDKLLRLAAELFEGAADLNAPADPNVLDEMVATLEGERLDTSAAEGAGAAMVDEFDGNAVKPVVWEMAPVEETREIVVPQPSAAEPVDYIAWVNSTLLPSDPEALELYDSAVAQTEQNKWTGDDELFDAAMAGDLAAVNSPEIQAWLAANSRALADFRAASHMNMQGRPLTPSEDGMMISVLLPNLAPLRTLAKMSAIEARSLQAAGQPQEAVNVLMDTVVAGAHTGKGPTLIESLVGVAMQALATDHMLDTFERDNGSIDYETVVQEWDARANERMAPISRTMQFERASSLDITQRVFEHIPETGQDALRMDRLSMVMSLTGESSTVSNLLFALNMNRLGVQGNADQLNSVYDDMSAAMTTPFPEARESLGAVEARLESQEFSGSMARLLVPSLARAYYHTSLGEARLAGTRTVAGILAYRQRNGALPDSLDQLGTNAVIDPFSGAPLVYERVGNDFRLYSVGGDGVDDGGVELDRSVDKGDLVYWPRPAKR
ncbi:MAG: hypothetical protein KDA32_01620 [Phycisphaerales bacterium]|nr:hypothetical protein [Phycisphaerales bacterium]